MKAVRFTDLQLVCTSPHPRESDYFAQVPRCLFLRHVDEEEASLMIAWYYNVVADEVDWLPQDL